MNLRIDKLVLGLLGKSLSLLTVLEKTVVDAVVKNESIATDVNEIIESESTFGERASDRIAAFGGSWTFIIFFLLIVIGWMVLNTHLLQSSGFDPYPYILLNLGLSSLAAFQAPIIMMSQNRQAAKDRIEMTENYKMSLKIDLELMAMHAKIDKMMEQRDAGS